MAFKFFVVPIRGGEAAEAGLNEFLRNHTVLSLDQRWVDQGSNSFSHDELRASLDRCRAFLDRSLRLRLKPLPYINRTSHGVDFLGCRVLPDRVLLTGTAARRTATGTSRRTGTTTWASAWPQLRTQEVDTQTSGTGRFPVSPSGEQNRTWAVLCW